jgi:V-type H+-transporting ATPase subunit F
MDDMTVFTSVLTIDLPAETQTSTIEAAFQDMTDRPDVAILLINQHIAEKIRPLLEHYTQAFPAVLEIPSKEHPYGRCLHPGGELRIYVLTASVGVSADPSKDSVLRRVKKLAGE